jgi:phage shock protein PspC (stress-responsive transcriptional regulator)
MNEITHIHLGHQPFAISVTAHRELKNYLSAIEKEVDDKEVMSEVELRIAELLDERGLSGDKVVLSADIADVMEQLGSPADFSGKDDVVEEPAAAEKPAKRLFRDTDNALIAGVSAGIANYTGLDVVIIRLLFVILAIFGSGLGIVIYILLWLAVPPAESASEKLQMHGKPVTLEALKDSVSQADVPGTVQRVNRRILPVINGIFRVSVKLLGIGFILAGLGVLIGTAFIKIYMLLHDNKLFQENLFPVGVREEWLLYIALGLAVVAAVFLLLTGIAALKRSWPLRGWLTGALAGLFLLGSTVGVALAADAAPHIRERYESTLHTSAVKGIQPFSKVVTTGEIDISYVSSPTYAANVHYVDHPDLSKLKINVKDGTL